MKFKYKRFEQFPRPVIPVKVKNGDHAVRYEVLVDSGADLCVFDAEIGELLGLDVENGMPATVGGVAGQSAISYMHEVELEVGGHPFPVSVGFLRRVAGESGYGIVGQSGFFEKFVVKFDFVKEQVELKERILGTRKKTRSRGA